MDNTIVDLASALAFVKPALLMAPEKLKEGIRAPSPSQWKIATARGFSQRR